jgi:hypothetical protein
MARPQEIELRQGYEDPAKVIGFEPIQLPDNTRALERNRDVEVQNLQRKAAAENRTAELTDLAEKINLSQNKDLLALSKMGQELLQVGLAKERERQIEIGVHKAREMGTSMESKLEYQQGLNKLEAAGTGLDLIANSDMTAGVPYEAAQTWKSLNYFQQVGFERAMAYQAGANYGTWMENAIDSNPDYVIETENGSFTLRQARSHPMLMAQAIKRLDSEYYKQYEFLGKNLNMLDDKAFALMNNSRDKLIGDARKAFAISDSARQERQAFEILVSENKAFQYINTVAGTVDEEGKHRNFKGAHDSLKDSIVTGVKMGVITPAQYNAILNSINPESGKRYRDEWPRRAFEIENAIAAANREDGKNAINDRKLEMDKDEQAFRDATFNTSLPLAEAKKFQKAFREKHYQDSQVIGNYINGMTMEARELEMNREYAQMLVDTFQLTPENFRRLPPAIQREFEPDYRLQTDALASPEFNNHLKGLENLIKGAAGADAAGELIGDIAPLIKGELEQQFLAKVNKALNDPLDKRTVAEKANQAFQEVRANFEQESKPGGRYFKDPMAGGKFTNFFDGSFTQESKNILLRDQTIQKAFQKDGRKWETPNLVHTKEELESHERGFDRPGWEIPEIYKRLGRAYGKNPLDIMNAQRVGAGLTPLKYTKSMEAAQALPPAAQHLLYQWQSANRNMRAWSQSGKFNKEIVPMSLGEEVEKAGKKYNIDPAIIAGVIDFENRGVWRSQISPVGAKGIAQIMPETAEQFGIDANDPIQSVDFVGKYLRHIMDNYDMTINQAIYAYNGGPTGVLENGIGFNKENREFGPGVMNAAAKYGYQGVWNDRSTMRPVFNVIEHVTGDRTHPNYAEDHGGSNYHEHIAFKSEQEMLRAKELLESKGYRVTSTYRDDLGSYHNQGLALDVAPPHDMPYDKESEAKWSRGIRQLLGIK